MTQPKEQRTNGNREGKGRRGKGGTAVSFGSFHLLVGFEPASTVWLVPDISGSYRMTWKESQVS
jgi:hypothetical protein